MTTHWGPTKHVRAHLPSQHALLPQPRGSPPCLRANLTYPRAPAPHQLVTIPLPCLHPSSYQPHPETPRSDKPPVPHSPLQAPQSLSLTPIPRHQSVQNLHRSCLCPPNTLWTTRHSRPPRHQSDSVRLRSLYLSSIVTSGSHLAPVHPSHQHIPRRMSEYSPH